VRASSKPVACQQAAACVKEAAQATEALERGRAGGGAGARAAQAARGTVVEAARLAELEAAQGAAQAALMAEMALLRRQKAAAEEHSRRLEASVRARLGVSRPAEQHGLMRAWPLLGMPLHVCGQTPARAQTRSPGAV